MADLSLRSGGGDVTVRRSSSCSKVVRGVVGEAGTQVVLGKQALEDPPSDDSRCVKPARRRDVVARQPCCLMASKSLDAGDISEGTLGRRVSPGVKSRPAGRGLVGSFGWCHSACCTRVGGLLGERFGVLHRVGALISTRRDQYTPPRAVEPGRAGVESVPSRAGARRR